MFSAILFAQDQLAARTIEQAASESNEVCIYKTMRAFVSPYELTRLVNSFSPDIVFVELTDFDKALALAREVGVLRPDAAVIGFTRAWDARQAREAAEAGVVEILTSPVTEQGLRQSVARAMRRVRTQVQDNLVAFLPAKAGAGATTLAVNVAGGLVRDLGQRVLAMDADLRSGLIAMVLKCQTQYSMLTALNNTEALDGALWDRIVGKAHGLHLLASPRLTEAAMVSWSGYHQLLQFARRRYDTIVVDLPELVNDATLEVVRLAKAVYIVATAELPSLVLARQRRQEMVRQGVPADRAGIILNRWTKNDIRLQDVEHFLGEPVVAVFRNDYHCVRRAMQEGRLIGRKTELGLSLAGFAAKLAGEPEPPQPPPQRSGLAFLESLLPRKTYATR